MYNLYKKLNIFRNNNLHKIKLAKILLKLHYNTVFAKCNVCLDFVIRYCSRLQY